MRPCAVLICAVSIVAAQSPRPATLRLRVTLVDSESNTRPVARHVMNLNDVPSRGTPRRVDLDFEGRAELSVPAGKYVLQSERPVEFQGRTYRWAVPIELKAGETKALDLTGDHATVEAAASGPGGSAPGVFGDWNGKYAGLAATLTIERLERQVYHGTLFVVAKRGAASTEVEVEVTLTGSEVQIKETKVARLGAVGEWNLGTSAGKLSANAREMSGGGKDSAGTPYKWSFARK